jgi:hypothetical protein
MNTIRRDGTGDDTGEQDVRELRRRHAGSDPLPTYEPYVRHREDVPHEDALPDFYGLEDDGVDAELSELVDAGELCMGVDPATGEVVYWFPEESTPAEEHGAPAPEPRNHRARRPRKRSTLYRRTVLTLVASVAPFFVGMTAEAALDMHAERAHPMDRPDVAGDEMPEPAPTEDVSDVTGYTHYVPASSGSRPLTPARHAKVTTSPTAEKPDSYVGKHRKALPKHAVAAVKATKKPESKTPKPAATAPAKTATTTAPKPPSPPKQEPHTPAETVVNGLVGTLESLLG